MRRIMAALLALPVLLALAVAHFGNGTGPAALAAPKPNCHRDHSCPTSSSTSATTTSSSTTSSTATTSTATSSSTASGGWNCVTSDPQGACQYLYSGITNSNGYDTYVANQCWADPTCDQTLSANSPGDWQVVAHEPAGNTGVRTYPDAQQLMNNWNGAGWNSCTTCADTPLSGLASLSSTYSEVTPRDGTIAQFAWDIWTGNNSGHPGEIMIWVDNSGRGSGGAQQVGTATIAGQAWTLYTYGTGELIWSLGAPGVFEQQGSGTVDILAILKESVRQGLMSSAATISQVNAGWEICSTGGVGQTFSVSSYALSMSAI